MFAEMRLWQPVRAAGINLRPRPCTLWQLMLQYEAENTAKEFCFYEIRYRNKLAFFHISIYSYISP